jgi:hypothetical protein
MTTEKHDATAQDHEATCLMCAVRALTEGDPAATWNPTEAGQTVSGVVLRQGTLATDMGPVPFVDLWQGGTGRVRVKAYGSGIQHALSQADAKIGDRLQVWFDGTRVIGKGAMAGRTVKMFSVNVQRGH